MVGPLTTIVVPTVGRPSLRVLLEALATGSGPAGGRVEAPVIVVDDRADGPDLAAELAELGSRICASSARAVAVPPGPATSAGGMPVRPG